ncbi:hypothetical protein [Salinibacterium sp. ZJ454]|nr:hypothetical protein [Salinibacterium sp. ZJ454]
MIENVFEVVTADKFPTFRAKIRSLLAVGRYGQPIEPACLCAWGGQSS